MRQVPVKVSDTQTLNMSVMFFLGLDILQPNIKKIMLECENEEVSAHDVSYSKG